MILVFVNKSAQTHGFLGIWQGKLTVHLNIFDLLLFLLLVLESNIIIPIMCSSRKFPYSIEGIGISSGLGVL